MLSQPSGSTSGASLPRNLLAGLGATMLQGKTCLFSYWKHIFIYVYTVDIGEVVFSFCDMCFCFLEKMMFTKPLKFLAWIIQQFLVNLSLVTDSCWPLPPHQLSANSSMIHADLGSINPPEDQPAWDVIKTKCFFFPDFINILFNCYWNHYFFCRYLKQIVVQNDGHHVMMGNHFVDHHQGVICDVPERPGVDQGSEAKAVCVTWNLGFQDVSTTTFLTSPVQPVAGPFLTIFCTIINL